MVSSGISSLTQPHWNLENWPCPENSVKVYENCRSKPQAPSSPVPHLKVFSFQPIKESSGWSFSWPAVSVDFNQWVNRPGDAGLSLETRGVSCLDTACSRAARPLSKQQLGGKIWMEYTRLYIKDWFHSFNLIRALPQENQESAVPCPFYRTR